MPIDLRGAKCVRGEMCEGRNVALDLRGMKCVRGEMCH